ncbi:MAG: deoxyribonuclease IV [Oscillospiraceae bacterium]|nr:deoxyribonuclease IV [Oscillospiraceae bacterium]
MFQIGCHVSSAGGYTAAAAHAMELGGNTFALFTRNPRGGSVKPLDEADMTAFNAFCRDHEMGSIVAHAPYTLNPCGAKENVRDFAFRAFSEDLARLEYVPGNYYNFHPGSHVGQGIPAGIELIGGLLNRVLWKEMHTTVLLETMAGKGSEVGGRFEDLRSIIDGVEHSEHLGVCLDTCHVWDGGYDIENDLDGVLTEFDRVVGLARLKAVHLNNSLNDRGSHKDRHARIAEGKLSLDAIRRIINHPALRELPFILETPQEQDSGYAVEIAMLREMRED